jgi:3-oxoacyl-[acyl-carrier protein] reductase
MDMTEKYGRSSTGKVALVAGGSRGIGEGIVRRFALDGAAIAFTYFNSEEKAKRLASEIEAAGGKALPIKADSASADDIRAAVDQVVKELGELDIFVNNAGVLIRGTIGS